VPDRIVVLGAGALSLGFLGPELHEEYALTFLDTQAKEDLVAEVRRRHEYATNLAGKDIRPLTIQGVDAFRLDAPE